jgi:hypothetical protein
MQRSYLILLFLFFFLLAEPVRASNDGWELYWTEWITPHGPSSLGNQLCWKIWDPDSPNQFVEMGYHDHQIGVKHYEKIVKWYWGAVEPKDFAKISPRIFGELITGTTFDEAIGFDNFHSNEWAYVDRTSQGDLNISVNNLILKGIPSRQTISGNVTFNGAVSATVENISITENIEITSGSSVTFDKVSVWRTIAMNNSGGLLKDIISNQPWFTSQPAMEPRCVMLPEECSDGTRPR